MIIITKGFCGGYNQKLIIFSELTPDNMQTTLNQKLFK